MPRSITELEQYLDREFGPIDNLVEQTDRRSRVMLDEAPDAGLSDLKDTVGDQTGKSGPALPEFEPQSYGASQEEGSMDRTRLFGAGVADLAEMVVGGTEYVARQNKFLRPSVAPALENVRGGINEIREGILSGVSPEYLERVGREVMTLDPSKSVWRSGNPIQVADAIYGKFVRSLPSTLAVMLPAGRLFKAGHTAGALTYLGASEGGLSVGAIANNITDEIKGMTNDELLRESPRYAEIYQNTGGDEAEARSRFTAEAQGIAPLVGGMSVAAISLATGRLLKPVFAPADQGLTLGKRAGLGFLEEFPQEGSQGVSEQMAQNFAAKIYDENRPLMEGALEAFGQEGLIGGLTGGAVAGAFGTRPAPPPPAPVDDVGGQMALPGFGPQQRDVPDPDRTAIPETDFDEDGNIVLRQDAEEVGKRNEQLDLGPGQDLEERVAYTTRGGDRVELPPEEQYRGRDLSDETGFTMPDTQTTPTGYVVWVEDTKGKTKGKESKLKRFETQAEADKYAARVKKSLDKEKGQQLRTTTGQRVAQPTQFDEQGQGQLPLGDRRPLAERGIGQRTIPPGEPTQLPDQLDQPTAEPVADIEAQLNDFKNKGGRQAVYLSPEQRNAPRQIPKGAKVLPNWDDKGGTLITKTAAAAKKAMALKQAVREGKMTLQEAIGELTLAGRGKPVQGRWVVQLLDDNGNVQRETMVATQSEALKTKRKWGDKARITTPDGAVYRRQQLMEQELRTDQEPITRQTQVDYKTRGGETRTGVVEQEGTTPTEEVDERQLDIETEINQKAEDERRQKDAAETEEAERKFRFEEGIREDFDENLSDEEIERLATYEVVYPEAYEEVQENKSTAYAERKKSKTFETRREAEEFAEKQDKKNKAVAISFGTTPTQPRIVVHGSEELDIVFERAVRAKGDRKAQTYDESPTGKDKLGFQYRTQTTAPVEDEEGYKQSITAGDKLTDAIPEGATEEDTTEISYAETASPATTVEKQARKDFGDTPGKKLKFIRRERGAQVRRKAEIRNVKDTKVVTKKQGGKKQTVATRTLTYESVPAEESRQGKLERLAKAKAARTRLRMALNRAKQFLKRFETSGAYGKYTGKGYLQAKKALEELVQLAESLLTAQIFHATYVMDGDVKTKQFDSRKDAERYLRRFVGMSEEQAAKSVTVTRTESNDASFITTANRLAKTLERIRLKTMTPEQFTKEFADIAEEQLLQEMRARPSDKRESIAERNRKIKKAASETKSRSKWREIRRAWSAREEYAKLIAPIMAKFTNAAFEKLHAIQGNRGSTDIVYTPTDTEIRQVKSVLKTWSAPGSKLNPDIFAGPLRGELQRLGFTFDEDGNVNGFEHKTTQDPGGFIQMPNGMIFPASTEAEVGQLTKPKPIKLESPELQAESREQLRAQKEASKAAALARQTAPKKRGRRKQMRPEAPPPGSRRAEVDERMEVAEKREAVRQIETANTLVERFKERVANSKVTNNGIKREEQRLIRALRKLGVWVDTGPSTGTISIGGYVKKHYTLVGPRLESKTNRLTKPEAKALIAKNARIAVPQELMPVWRMTRRRSETDRRKITGSVYDPQIENLLEQSDQEIIDLFMEGLDLQENSPALDKAASEVGDMIRDRYSRQPINNVLDAIVKNLPENHFYRRLAEKLRSMGMGDIQIHYDWAGVKFTGRKKNNWGLYDPKTGRVYLNRRVMGENMDSLSSVKAIHTILHETLHAATAAELKKNWALRNHFFQVRAAAIAAWKQQYGSKNMPYGLQLKQVVPGRYTPVDEFVAEVFASKDLQDFLKGVPVTLEGSNGTMSSAWRAIKDAIVNLLGWGNVPNVTNLFEAFMAPADMVFQSAGQIVESEDMNLAGVDDILDSVQNAVLAKVNQRNEIWKRLKERVKNPNVRFSGFAMNLMTMEQFVEAFYKFFNITDAEGNPFNPLRKYHRAFQERNGHAAERMERPTELSGKWTSLEESDPDAALEMSRVMSESTLYRITADQPLTHEDNAHLTAKEQTDKHKEMHDRFNALPEAAKKLYREVRAYYKDVSAEEQRFLLQSGLRSITGVTFTEEQLAKVETKADLHELLKEHINDTDRAELIDTLYEMSRIPTKHKGDYFPAMRYGDNVVYAEGERSREVFEDRASAKERRAELAATDPTLDVSFSQNKEGDWEVVVMERDFRMAETKSEIMQEHENLKAEYGSKPHMTIYAPQRRRRVLREEAIRSNAQLQSILTALSGDTAAQAAIKNFYLRSLSETSMRKHELTRKNRRGLNYDMQHRNLATYARQASYYISQLQFGWQMAEAMDDMNKFLAKRTEDDTYDISRVVEHLKKRDEMGTDLPEINNLVRSGVEGTHFFMLTSPSYWAINATQPFMVTLPTLAGKFGYGNSIAMMRQTMKLITPTLGRQAIKSKFGVKALTDRELREESFNIINQLLADLKANTSVEDFKEFDTLLKNLRRQHIIDINVFTEMRELSQGKVAGENATARQKAKSGWTTMVDASRVMAHLTEVNNRVLTSLTAYQLARNNGMSVEEATEYAGNITSQTQFNYSSANKPPLFQAGGPLGSLAPLMFQFMQWPQHMYAHLIRNYMGMVEAGVMNKSEARTALLGLLGTHAFAGGLVGMTLQPIKWAIGLALMGLGDDDEPYTLANALSGQTFDQLVAETMAELFGTDLGTVFTKGLPAQLGFDLSTRMSMGTLYFVDLRGDNPTSVLGSLAASFGGATLNQGLSFSRGLGQAMDGDILRGLETASPKFGRDVLRAIRYYNEGLVNANGDTVIDSSEMSLAEIVTQSIGFAPTDVGDFYDAQAAIKGKERYVLDRRERLLKQFRDATTLADKRRVRSEIRAFNRGNRQEAITVDALWSTREAQFKREYRYRRLGANIDEEKARFYREYGEPYRD